MTTDELEKLVDQAFQNLAARHDLKMIDACEDAYGAQITLANKSAAIRIRWECLDERFLVSLHRLDHGAIAPTRDLSERRRDPLNGFDADDLIALRAPEKRVIQRGVAMGDVLRQYADVLEREAVDLLSGKFVVFRDLTRVVAQRIEQRIRDGHPVGPDAQVFRKAAQEAGLASRAHHE